jgi:hypothetical protein
MGVSGPTVITGLLITSRVFIITPVSSTPRCRRRGLDHSGRGPRCGGTSDSQVLSSKQPGIATFVLGTADRGSFAPVAFR